MFNISYGSQGVIELVTCNASGKCKYLTLLWLKTEYDKKNVFLEKHVGNF